MSWCDRKRGQGRRRGRGFAAAALLALAFALPGCGFHPLYGGQRLAIQDESLASVRIMSIKDREGQILHNYLLTALNPGGQPRFPAYNLDVQLKQTTVNLGIQKDETATRANMTLNANFTLTRLADGKKVFHGQSQITNSYNILTSHFATIVSQQDATDRAARALADDIKTRLGIYFAQVREAASNGR